MSTLNCTRIALLIATIMIIACCNNEADGEGGSVLKMSTDYAVCLRRFPVAAPATFLSWWVAYMAIFLIPSWGKMDDLVDTSHPSVKYFAHSWIIVLIAIPLIMFYDDIQRDSDHLIARFSLLKTMNTPISVCGSFIIGLCHAASPHSTRLRDGLAFVLFLVFAIRFFNLIALTGVVGWPLFGFACMAIPFFASYGWWRWQESQATSLPLESQDGTLLATSLALKPHNDSPASMGATDAAAACIAFV